MEKTRLQSSKRDSDGYSKSGPKVVQKYSIEWSNGVLDRFFSPLKVSRIAEQCFIWETRVASRQIKLAFSSFTVSFWTEENLKYFYNTFKEIKKFKKYMKLCVLLIEAIPRLKSV